MLDRPDLPTTILRAITQRHGFGSMPVRRVASLGVVNAIYLLGDSLVLRVPKALPEHIAEAHTEALVVPVARAAGVATPAIVAFDAALDLLPVPYAIYERVPGVTLASLNLPPSETEDAYRALGSDLARLHLRDLPAADPLAGLPLDSAPEDASADPRQKLESLAREGYLWGDVARWLLAWLERLAPAALSPVPRVVCHNDAWPGNVIVQPETRAYIALLD